MYIPSRINLESHPYDDARFIHRVLQHTGDVFVGNGSVVQVLLSQETVIVAAAPSGNGYGAYQSIS